MTTATHLGAQGAQRPTRSRYLIMVMLFITVVINYLDRSNLSIAAPALKDEFGLDTVHEGLILSAFGWTYAAMQIPGGWLVDRVAPRVLYAAALILWSAATFFMGFASSFIVLFVLRLAVGALEAPAYPINNRVVTTWFPERNAPPPSASTSGQFVGLAFLTPVLAWLQHHYGWHMVFVSTGLLGIVWGVVWFMVYREPRQFKGANAAEIELIQQGGGVVDLEKRVTEEDAPRRARKTGFLPPGRLRLGRPGGERKRRSRGPISAWSCPSASCGAYLGQFCLTSTLWFFLTWFPTYLVKYRGMDFIKSGFLASVPFLAAFVGVLCSGVLSDFLIRRGATVGLARKLPIILGLLISTSMIGANFTDSTPWVIFFLAVAFFGNGLASITWSLVSALAPVRLLGLTGGVFNFVGNLSSICTPIVIGLLVSRTASRPPSCTCPRCPAALSYILLVGKVERIEA